MNNRVVELAIEALEAKRAAIDVEIAVLRTQLNGGTQPKSLPGRRRPKTAAEKRAQAEAMRAYWAAKKQASSTSAASDTAPANGKRRPKTAAERETLSKKLKAAWKKRKAGAKKKGQ